MEERKKSVLKKKKKKMEERNQLVQPNKIQTQHEARGKQTFKETLCGLERPQHVQPA
jgi:hypothetical protein